MPSQTVTVGSRVGLHARPAALIAEAVSKAGGPKLDRRLITIGSPIKSLGAHSVSVKVHPEVEATIALNVVAAK